MAGIVRCTLARMEAGSRHLGLNPETRQRLLVLAGAALLTALLFGGLFEVTAYLTNWILTSGFERFERLHPWARIAGSILPAYFLLLAGLAVGIGRYRKQRTRTQAHRRTPGF
jgi:hypothetical protein